VDVTLYWTQPPPVRSGRLRRWLDKFSRGWRPNSRIRSMGYHEASEFYGVYIWEYLNVIRPALQAPARGG
jgi:hypothetical protein